MTIPINFGDNFQKKGDNFQKQDLFVGKRMISGIENPYLCRMKHVILSVFIFLLLLSCQQAPEVVQHGDIAFLPMEAKRLPDMNEPRSGHALVWADNHLLAIGGHTKGFVPTATAEYYEGGRWHTLPTLYPHDTPFALVMENGDVLVGGGYESSFGVGQTYGVECYHPATHSFTPKPIMDRKRAHASALELEDGRIVISGNWWASDLTELYNGDSVWTDTTSDNRSYPIILPITKDSVWIIGGTYGSYGSGTQNIVDQIKGEPFSVDLLAEWRPQTPRDRNRQADACRVAENTFLIPALNAEGQCAPMVVDSTGFSLLPMERPIPTEGPWGTIRYEGSFWTVPETQTAWLMGIDHQKHVFLAEIKYQPALQGGKAQLSMHYAPAIEQLPLLPWEIMLPDGTFVSAGGMITSNYDVTDAVFAFNPKVTPTRHVPWLMISLGLAIVLGVMAVFMARKRKRGTEAVSDIPIEDIPTEDISSNAKQILGDRLNALMEEKQFFKNKDLRIADVATELCTNTSYLSTYLNGDLNTTFPAFVMGYRIRYAQELMRNDPAMRLSQVAEESGFTNERNFLRTFKAICGVTPSEWKSEQVAKGS